MKKRLLTEKQLRFVLSEALLLLEGFKQDKEAILELVKDNAELVTKVSNFKPPAISWLIKRYGPGAKIQETHPIGDSILTLEKYILKVPQIKTRWQSRSKKNYSGRSWGEILELSYKQNNRNPSWKKPPYDWENINTWNQSPMDWGKMTADEMSQIMTLSDLKKSKNTVKEEDLPEKFIKKIGPWNIWLPATKSDSIRIAGFDPITMKSHVTWCTARTDGSNLFYTYNAVDKYLIYIIKDNPRPTPDPAGVWDYISIGISKGKVEKDRGVGGSTVQRENNRGMPRGEFWNQMKAATGPYYDQIMTTVEQVASSYTDSPSVAIQLKAAQDPAVMRHVIGGLGFREKLTELSRLARLAKSKNVIMTPEVKTIVINLLKIRMPNGLYNLEKFPYLNEAMQTIVDYDEKYFNSITGVRHIFSFVQSNSTSVYHLLFDSERNIPLMALLRILKGSRIQEGESLSSLADKLGLLLEAEQMIDRYDSLFKKDVKQFLLEKINSARINFKSIANLIKQIYLVSNVSEANSIYNSGIKILSNAGYDKSVVESLDNFFIEKVSETNMPLDIINRNINKSSIRNKILEFPEVLKSLKAVSSSKELIANFYRDKKEISHLILSLKNIASENAAKNFVNALISTFDVLSTKEIFTIVGIIISNPDSIDNDVFLNSVENIKRQQPEKFKALQAEVSNLMFPPQFISDAFDTETETVDDFLDDLLGDDLFQI